MFLTVLLTVNNLAQEQTENTKNSIFVSPFFPEQLSFSDVLGIISVVLAVISIVLAIIIYKLSNDTSEKLAEEAARRAFEKQNNIEGGLTNKSEESIKVVRFTKEQCKIVKKLLNQLIKKAKKNSIDKPWVHAASFPILLKNEFSEEEAVHLMYEWKEKSFISWTGTLENSTKVYIKRGDLILEDIDSR